MASNIPECFLQLSRNSKEDFVKAANLLLRIARNIINNPSVEKYQSIQIGSKTFMENLLPVDGGVQCLLEMGFEESHERFQFRAVHFEKLKNLKLLLEKYVQGEQAPPSVKSSASNEPSSLTPNRESEAATYRKIVSHYEHVLKYENPRLQAKARSVIPIEALSKKANENLSNNPQFSGQNGNVPLHYDDCMILALLEWFKCDFFKWVDSPSCPHCAQSKCRMAKMLQPTNEELKWDAHRVEGHLCDNCGSMVRFPRYNNPEKLLETREGRCGEWANCFTLLCRSLGYDSRHIMDWTDHVWTEVYSKAAQRWLHCDPCENAFDKPLLYEQGWGKKLSLLIAASCDEVVDVTWRYSDKPKEVMPRRNSMFRENWLESVLKKLNAKRQNAFPSEKMAILQNRKIQEVREFVSPKIKSSVVYGGRTSGSVGWRTERGEMGEKPSVETDKELCPKNFSGPKDDEFFLRYFSKSNQYQYSLDRDTNGWESLSYSSTSIQRKEEFDWKMVYLARAEAADKAHICWKFDLKHLDEKVIIKSAEVYIESTEFQSGNIKLLLCTDSKTVVLKNNEKRLVKDDIFGARSLSVHVFMSGGDGENAWQHTQLFRTSTKSDSDEPQLSFSIKYGLK